VTEVNLDAAWIGILLGSTLGAAQGLFFHREDWLGGYGAWRRRMLRLGHIAFFGLALINLAFALTARALEIEEDHLWWPSRLFLVGAVGMPPLCYLSALWMSFRHLFFIPALSVIVGSGLFLAEVLGR
jgi:hypothetical protein